MNNSANDWNFSLYFKFIYFAITRGKENIVLSHHEEAYQMSNCFKSRAFRKLLKTRVEPNTEELRKESGDSAES